MLALGWVITVAKVPVCMVDAGVDADVDVGAVASVSKESVPLTAGRKYKSAAGNKLAQMMRKLAAVATRTQVCLEGS